VLHRFGGTDHREGKPVRLGAGVRVQHGGHACRPDEPSSSRCPAAACRSPSRWRGRSARAWTSSLHTSSDAHSDGRSLQT
jgi:hypothetical protein